MARLRTVLSLGLLISLTSAAYGDIQAGRSPLPKPPMVAPVKIAHEKLDDPDPNVVAKIIIPRSLLPDLQESSRATLRSQESPPMRTIFAGLVLTAVAISLMFAYKTSTRRKKAVIGLMACVVVFGIALLVNSLFPPETITSTLDQSQPQRLILIEVQEFGHEVTLILPNSN